MSDNYGKEANPVGFLQIGGLNPDKATVNNNLVGANIANQQFLAAMVRFLPATTIFVPDDQIKDVLYDVSRIRQNSEKDCGDAKVVSLQSLSPLKPISFRALHNPAGLWLDSLSLDTLAVRGATDTRNLHHSWLQLS